MKLWKVVKELDDRSLLSAWATGEWMKRYSRGHWTRARKLSGGETVAFLYAFRSLEDAREFAASIRQFYQSVGIEIWEAEGTTNRRKPRCASTSKLWWPFWSDIAKRRVTPSAPAPAGTVLCKRIKLVRRVDGEAGK